VTKNAHNGVNGILLFLSIQVKAVASNVLLVTGQFLTSVLGK